MAKPSKDILFQDLTEIIEQGKKKAVAQVNSTLTITYWQVGNKINTHILQNERAEYGKEIVSTISLELELNYGSQFNEKNLRRMIRFSEVFSNFEIVASLVRQLSWSHFLILIPLKTEDRRLFYANQIKQENWTIRETRRQIERKAYERKEIAQTQLIETTSEIQNTFKDPYFLDFLGLKDGYLENDLESSILKELENFILELGKGFAFVERQKRIIIDEEDFYIDLLFFHRTLKRLVVIELKLGKFIAAYKGQIELYLKWLDKHEKQEGENPPIGLILCAEKSSEQIELLEMGKDGIMVAEYLTELPSKEKLEAKLHQSIVEAKARIESKRLLGD